MARDGAGVYSKLAGSVAVTSTTIQSNPYNQQIDDIVNALNDTVLLNGLKPMTGLQTLSGDGTAALHPATVQQAQKGIVGVATAVAGTVDAIQITMSPASTTWTSKEKVEWVSAGPNTITTPTISKDGGVTNKTIVTASGGALAVGATGASGVLNRGYYDGTNVRLISSQSASGSITASGYTQNTSKLLGRTTASAGAIEEISIGAGLTLSAGSLAASGSSAPAKHTTVLTAGTTWTTNANHKWVTVTVIGGGGGSGGCGASPTNGSGGGQGGGVAVKTYTNLTPSTGYTIAIGGGGSAGSGAGTAGGAGGATTFTDGTTLITGNGGSGGAAGGGSPGAGGSAAGTATNGDINIKGFPGCTGVVISGGVGGGPGGASGLGYGGGGVTAAGNLYGGGAGGVGAASTAGFVGGAGAIIIEEWY